MSRILVEAMQSAAAYHQELPSATEKERVAALTSICLLKSMVEPVRLKKHDIPLQHPMDDDFVSLMKYHMDDKYIKQWLSREYQLKPLWKNTAEFYANFKKLRGKKLEKDSWIFSENCRDYISDKFSINKDNIWIEEATPKYRSKFADRVFILMNDKLVKYEDLLPKDRNSFYPDIQPFYYIYTTIKDKDHRQTILDELSKKVDSLFF